MGALFRLKPTMASRKLMALDFIKRYFAEYGASPSLDEIAAGLEVTKQRAHELVGQLAADCAIVHVPGKRRGIALMGGAVPFSQGDALLLLRALGWVVASDDRRIGAPGPSGVPPGVRGSSLIHVSLTNAELPALPHLDHDPGLDIDVGTVNGAPTG